MGQPFYVSLYSASLSSFWMMANLTPLFRIPVDRPFYKPVSSRKPVQQNSPHSDSAVPVFSVRYSSPVFSGINALVQLFCAHLKAAACKKRKQTDSHRISSAFYSISGSPPGRRIHLQYRHR